MLPISIGGVYWIAVVVDLKARRFEYLDSLHGSDASGCVANVRRWLNDESEAKRGKPVAGLDRWPARERKDIPKQSNGCEQRGMVKHRRRLALDMLRYPEAWH